MFKALRVKLTLGISPLVAFACLSASYFAHIGFFNPYLSLWLKSQGASLYVIGLMASIQSFTRIFAPYGWGWLSDHTGERVWLLRFCASVAVLCSVFMKGASMTLLAGLLLIMFIHTSAMMPMTEAALSHWVSHEGRFDAKRYGRVRLCGSFGFLLTVCLAGFWFERYGLEDFAGWTSLTLLLVNLGAWLIPNTKESVHSHTSQESILRIVLKPHNRWFFLTMFFHVLSHMCIYFYLSLYLDQLAYNKTTIGLFWGGGGDCRVLYAKLLDSRSLAHGVAQAVYPGDGRENGLDRLGCGGLATVGVGANDARIDLCSASHRVHDLAQ